MADFPLSYIVCDCHNVSLGEIIYSIKDKNAKSIEDIGTFTDAGTSCGYCRCKEDDHGDPKMKLYLEQIINKFASK